MQRQVTFGYIIIPLYEHAEAAGANPARVCGRAIIKRAGGLGCSVSIYFPDDIYSGLPLFFLITPGDEGDIPLELQPGIEGIWRRQFTGLLPDLIEDQDLMSNYQWKLRVLAGEGETILEGIFNGSDVFCFGQPA